jgi:heavy metal translocating P-type ATPase
MALAHAHAPHDGCCDHQHLTIDLSADGTLLDRAERRRLAVRLSLAVLCAGLLILALAVHVLVPAQRDVAALVAGLAAALVAWPVATEALRALRAPSLHGVTDLLVATAMVAAWCVGDLESAALVPLAMVIGHVLEERSLLGSREAIAALGRLTQVAARRLAADGSVTEVAADRLVAGDRLEVRPGDRIAADGLVREGSSAIDTAPITGESVPIEVSPGSAVDAGTINQEGRLVIEVTRTGGQTTLGRVVALMREAESSKPPVTRLLERYAGSYLLLILLVAACVLFLSGSVSAMMAVLVASCPCALVLAAPATAIASLAVAGRHGILVKGTAFLEELAEVDSLIIDKTGTVTLGQLQLVAVQPAPGLTESDVRALAAGLGAASSHPVSRAIAAAVESDHRASVSAISEVSGLGVSGTIDGEAAFMGRAAFLTQHAVIPELPAHDGPVVGVVRGGRFQGWLLLADEPRPEAKAALADLRALGLAHQVLLTGDRKSVALSTAARLGLDEVEAEVLPQQKLDRVLAEIKAGRRPLVVGDGVNDALALKAGAVGVAMGAKGADVALASADLVLMSSDLRRLGSMVRLSRHCRRTVNLNVGIGLGWTFGVIALAAGGLIGPVAAVMLHNLGTLAVMANAGRLLRFDETA